METSNFGIGKGRGFDLHSGQDLKFGVEHVGCEADMTDSMGSRHSSKQEKAFLFWA